MKTEYKDEVLTVWLTGEIDHNSASKIRKAIDSKVSATRPKTLELNFAQVSFMDSSGIGLIMGRYRSVGLVGGNLRVTQMPQNLSKIVELSGINALGVIK